MEHIHNTLAVPCKKSKMVSFGSSIIKNIVALAVRSKLLFLFCCFFLFLFIYFYLGFLSRTVTIHRTAGEGGGYFFESSLPLSPASQILRH